MKQFIRLSTIIRVMLITIAFAYNAKAYAQNSSTTTFTTSSTDSLSVEERIHEAKDDVKIMFRVSSSNLENDFADNRAQIRQLDRVMSDTAALMGLDSLEIVSAASIDGSYANNERLATNRALAVRDYLVKNYPQVTADLFKTKATAEDWDGLRDAVEADRSVPNKNEVLSIIDNDNISADDREAKLRQVDNGSSWTYLTRNILPKQRYGASVVFYYNIEKIERHIRHQRDTIVKVNTIVMRDTIVQQDTVVMRDTVERKCAPMKYALKTNLLYAGLTYTPNLAFEIALSDQWSLDVAAGYNPWNRNGKPGNNKKLVHWMAQIEGRYYLDRVFKGHFFGAHVLGTKYNISNHELPWLFEEGSEEYRYCGWGAGAGLSYGYHWCLSDRWGIEANIGAGYIYQNYDKYTHPRCGYEVESDVVNHYLGITRAGLSIIYKFGRKD